MIDAIGNEITPIEEIEPEIAEFFRRIANKEKPFGVKSLSFTNDGDVSIKTDTIKVEKIGRNDPCPYCAKNGISIKWKKCKIHNN